MTENVALTDVTKRFDDVVAVEYDEGFVRELAVNGGDDVGRSRLDRLCDVRNIEVCLFVAEELADSIAAAPRHEDDLRRPRRSYGGNRVGDECFPATGSIGFGTSPVSGRIRVPFPTASTIVYIACLDVVLSWYSNPLIQ